MLELLQDGALGEISDQVKEALQIMSRSNRNLLEMVNKLLDVYRYKAGNKTINPQRLDLTPLIKEVIQELSPIAKTKSLFLGNHLTDQPLIIHGDRLELIRVFNNLIGNALKFTDKGGVTIHTTTTSTSKIQALASLPKKSPSSFSPFLRATITNKEAPIPLHHHCPPRTNYPHIPTQSKQYPSRLFTQSSLKYT